MFPYTKQIVNHNHNNLQNVTLLAHVWYKRDANSNVFEWISPIVAEHRLKRVRNDTVNKHRKWLYNPVVHTDCVLLSSSVACNLNLSLKSKTENAVNL
jgi:hypothetical protein